MQQTLHHYCNTFMTHTQTCTHVHTCVQCTHTQLALLPDRRQSKTVLLVTTMPHPLGSRDTPEDGAHGRPVISPSPLPSPSCTVGLTPTAPLQLLPHLHREGTTERRQSILSCLMDNQS